MAIKRYRIHRVSRRAFARRGEEKAREDQELGRVDCRLGLKWGVQITNRFWLGSSPSRVSRLARPHFYVQLAEFNKD